MGGMAFRIHDSVVRGEIDNRVKGIVRGKIWVERRAEPIVLELKGNAWPDLAGCLLRFVNPKKRIQHPGLDSLAPIQRGTIGDLTASRKVRVFDPPVEEAYLMSKRGEKPPEHMANCLYLEWFSTTNGRVVIESADYELTISPPEWRMTPEDEMERAQQAAESMQRFLSELTKAIEKHQRGQKSPEEQWDEHDYEKFMKECDARTAKYGELLDKYGDSEEANAIIDKEMGWDRDLTEEEADEEQRRIQEIDEICEAALGTSEPDPHREGIDWVRTEDGDVRHPLQHRCHESALRFSRAVDELNIDGLADQDLEQFIFEFHTTAAKLAGALGSIARGRYSPEPSFTVAYLKRALGHLHRSQAGLEAIASRDLLPNALVTEARKELFEIRQSILNLMDKFRGR